MARANSIRTKPSFDTLSIFAKIPFYFRRVDLLNLIRRTLKSFLHMCQTLFFHYLGDFRTGSGSFGRSLLAFRFIGVISGLWRILWDFLYFSALVYIIQTWGRNFSSTKIRPVFGERFWRGRKRKCESVVKCLFYSFNSCFHNMWKKLIKRFYDQWKISQRCISTGKFPKHLHIQIIEST